MSLDDFPTRDNNSDLAGLAEVAFENAITEAAQFIVQHRDRHDYGTDFQLEAKNHGEMTNFRSHVQLKGTDKAANRDGSISIAVRRTNLNYLLSQPNSVYVCYYSPTKTLLVRSAEDVFRDAEHKGEEWRSQESLTVRFHVPFDFDFQVKLHARVVAVSTTGRNDRLHWIATPPDYFPQEVLINISTITIPESPDEAFEVLNSLYENQMDDVISEAFEQFFACFNQDDPRLTYVYLSEINLAMRSKHFKRERVSEAIAFIQTSRPDNGVDALYCLANGHNALGQANEAKQLYQEAIQKSTDKHSSLEAQCWKNLGTVFEQEGDHAEACRCYKQAIELSPDLMEAHFALAQFHQDAGNLKEALYHFDQVIWESDDLAPTLAVRGHRLEVYFRLGMNEKAFDEIAVLFPHGDRHPWIRDWCAKMVYNYARTNESSVSQAIRFWDSYLRKQPKDRPAQKERLLCLAYAKMNGQTVKIDYRRYETEVSAYLDVDAADSAYLWDRTGHWAQVDGDWKQAEQQYRKAYLLEPDRYGYCLGTALNFLKRFEEALPILLHQINAQPSHAQNWFQIAVAQEGTGDIEACKESYHLSINLDPEYDLAIFNLGAIYWNHGSKEEAICIWKDALRRFPSHLLAEKLRQQFPEIFSKNEGK